MFCSGVIIYRVDNILDRFHILVWRRGLPQKYAKHSCVDLHPIFPSLSCLYSLMFYIFSCLYPLMFYFFVS